MDITDSVTGFLNSIDWSLLWPVLGAFLTLTIVLKLRSFSSAVLKWWAVRGDKDIRVGGVYRFSTPTGYKIGVLTSCDFRYCRFKFTDHYERIPNTDLAYGQLQIVRIDPGEESEPVELNNKKDN